MKSKTIYKFGIFASLCFALALVLNACAPDTVTVSVAPTTSVATRAATTSVSPETTLSIATTAPTASPVVTSAPDPTPQTTTITTSTQHNDWLQFDLNPQHSGSTNQETVLNKSNVDNLQKLFQVSLPSSADGAPVYLSAVNTATGLQDLLFVTTRAGDIVALNAQSGTQVWIQHNPAGSCKINGGGTTCYTTSSPAIDPDRQFIYSYGLDGYAHKYKVEDGTEIKSGGWPELTTTKNFDEKGSSALTTATAKNGVSYLYVAHAGYPGDRGDYQGHLTTINLKDGTQHVFNAVCSNQTDTHFVEKPSKPDCLQKQTAIWSRPSVVYDADTDRIYMVTGNGDFLPDQHAWGDTVFALNPDGTGSVKGDPLDTYTPADFKDLEDTDADIGSTAPAILPAPSSSKVKALGVQGGKDEKLRLLDLANLSGKQEIGRVGSEIGTVIKVPQGGQVLTTPAVWVNNNSTWVFVTNSSGISGLKLAVAKDGTPSLQVGWMKKGEGGTSPIVVNGVLYYTNSNKVMALDPSNGNQLWQDTSTGSIHWNSPIVVNGIIYLPDNDGKLTAFGLKFG